MEIQWLGHYCFRLSQRGKATVLTDPFDASVVGYKPIQTRADVVTVSRPGPEQGYVKGVRGVQKVLHAPGEYEIGGVFIWGIALRNPKTREPELLFVFDYEDVVVAHLGGLRHLPSESEVEGMGTIHVALVPVGGSPHNGLTPAQAAEIVSLLEPNIVVPMAYRTPHTRLRLESLEAFLKALGEKKPQKETELRIASTDKLPEEPRIVVLEPKI